jgi:hypothetical protein
MLRHLKKTLVAAAASVVIASSALVATPAAADVPGQLFVTTGGAENGLLSAPPAPEGT